MYFRDRAEAGAKLAEKLAHYRFENTAVLALSPGGVQVGEEIARQLHCSLSMLVTEKISAPGDESLVLGTMDQTGRFTYNNLIPAGEMEEYMQDMRNYLEEEKVRRLYDMTAVLSEGGVATGELMKGRNIIIATDGVKNGLSYEAAFNFLKPIATEKIIAAIPIGPAEVIERLSSEVDELQYLYIPDNFISVRHYYEDNTPVDPDAVIDSINSIIARWK